LPIIEVKYLTQLFSAVLPKEYFPAHWEVAQIILILKPGNPNELTSYHPIGLLPVVSKAFEKLLLNDEMNELNECLRHVPRRSLSHVIHLFNYCLQLSYFP
jgi:hypothetical protein